MKVMQFYDKALGHASYAILSQDAVALVDPGRDPQPYIDFAESNGARIIAVFETHPHADFASCHLELHNKLGAKIYINPKVGVSYPFEPMEDGDEVKIGEVTVKALFTPGHSPDHNSYLLMDEMGKPHSVYTGDSLFVGDVGRPDLREGAGHIQMERENLAKMMYNSLKQVFEPLEDDVLVYPAHGAGSLCGKQMAEDTYSTIGQEKEQNWAFQVADEKLFVKSLLEDQPFIPKYFPYEVEVNRAGSAPYEESVTAVPRLEKNAVLNSGTLVIDTRPQEEFKNPGHLDKALNIMEGDKFETWLGSIVGPEERYYLVAKNDQELDSVIRKAAKIAYEKNIAGALVMATDQFETPRELLDLEDFRNQHDKYFVVDIRNATEFRSGKFFDHAVNIPLHELREKAHQITTEKPIVVHCAGGYRSAAGYSILSAALPENKVYDLSEAVEEFVEKSKI